MTWLVVTKKNNEAAGEWSEENIDIHTNYPLAEVRLIVHGLGHASQTADTLLHCIDKVDIIADGHKTIKSLSSRQIRALATIRDGFRPFIKTSTGVTVQTYVSIPIRFGFVDYDTTYILPTKLFEDLTMKVKPNATNWGYFTGGARVTIELLQFCGELDLAKTFILKEEEVFNKPSATAEVSETLAIGEIYSGLMIYNSVVGGNEYLPISVELSEGAFVPFRSTLNRIMCNMERKLDINARLELTASGNITTNFSWIPFTPPIATKDYTELRFKQDRSGAATTAVAVAQKIIPAEAFVGVVTEKKVAPHPIAAPAAVEAPTPKPARLILR